MSEYDKLTVIKLREELVKRSLPKNGLKAALVQRLVEADAQSGGANAVPGGPAVKEQPDKVVEDDPITQDAPAPTPAQDEVYKGADTSTSKDTLQPTEPEVKSTKGLVAEESGRTPAPAPEGALSKTPAKDEAKSEAPPVPDTAKSPIVVVPIEEVSAPSGDLQDEVLPGNLTQAANSKDPSSEPQLPTPSQTLFEQTQVQEGLTRISTQGSVTGEEIIEDSRKRKRRSQSPPPSSIDTQKRLKSNNARPHVELPEDSTLHDATTEDSPRTFPSFDGPSSQGAENQINGHGKTGDESKAMGTPPSTEPANDEDATPTQNGAAKIEDADASKETIHIQGPAKITESPMKPSPSGTRFKNLFTAPSMPDSLAKQPPFSDTEDRVVTPALHPATSALYIRELMRPLKPETVKDYLMTLATSPNTAVDSSIVTDFHLDSIRTHCLVGFANISAASRVRSSLHNRIWPNERDRRPLSVDFVPEVKLKKWIGVEQSAPSGRGQPMKKWEVVYEDEEGEIKAYLQEVGSGHRGLDRAAVKLVQPAAAGQGVQGAPSGPRVRESEPRAEQPRVESGKGFQALDDLFKSTVAKPKLYYQPVAKAEVNKRLVLLAAGRGGGRSDETQRFSFEDDIIVNKGPDFGNRGRGGYGGRGGGFPGGYRRRGRGGGYRGDGYRGGDGYRDRR